MDMVITGNSYMIYDNGELLCSLPILQGVDQNLNARSVYTFLNLDTLPQNAFKYDDVQVDKKAIGNRFTIQFLVDGEWLNLLYIYSRYNTFDRLANIIWNRVCFKNAHETIYERWLREYRT